MAILYKYKSPDGLAHELLSSKLSFSKISALNDIFEFGISIKSVSESIDAKLLSSLIEKEKEKGTDWTCDGLIDEFNVPFETLGLDANDLKSLFWWQAIQRQFDDVGILSLSLRRDSQLMWAHYGKNHTGFVLGFDEKDPAFSGSQAYGVRGPKRVRYKRDRIVHASQSQNTLIRQACFVKSRDWSYEKEVRCIRTMDPELPRLTEHFLPDSLKEIIIGARMDLKTLDCVYRLKTDKYKDAKLLICLPSSTTFEMDIIPAPDKLQATASLLGIWPGQSTAK